MHGAEEKNIKNLPLLYWLQEAVFRTNKQVVSTWRVRWADVESENWSKIRRIRVKKIEIRTSISFISHFLCLIGLKAQRMASSGKYIGADVVVLVWEGLNLLPLRVSMAIVTLFIIVSLVFWRLHSTVTGDILLLSLWYSCRIFLP